MKVRIVKASKSSYWYATHIGEVFEVRENSTHSDRYTVCDNAILAIYKADTVIEEFAREKVTFT